MRPCNKDYDYNISVSISELPLFRKLPFKVSDLKETEGVVCLMLFGDVGVKAET